MQDCPEKPYAEKDPIGCTAVVYQAATVSVPVTVQPKVNGGNINIFCCGDPKITPSPCRIMCNPSAGGCSFIVTQNICVEIPIEFSADVFVNCPYVACGDATVKPR